MFGFLIALISGALMSIQGVLNTGLTRQTGIWLSAGWVQISAFFTCVVLWLFSERTPISSLLSVRPHGHRRGSGCLHHLDRHTQYG